jgi:hypothetical protein
MPLCSDQDIYTGIWRYADNPTPGWQRGSPMNIQLNHQPGITRDDNLTEPVKDF